MTNSTTNISIHTILCPTDFSAHAAAALAESFRIARWFGAKVAVLHVPPPALPVAADIGFVPRVSDYDEAAVQAALKEIQSFVDRAEPKGVPVELLCRVGDPSREIRRAADDIGASLIVMGTHGLTGWRKLMLGSVTEAILRVPPVPVLVVHKEAQQPATGLFRRVLCAVDGSEWSARTISFAVSVVGEGAEHLTVLRVVEELPEIRARAEGVLWLREVEEYRKSFERQTLAELQDLIPEAARPSCEIEQRVTFGLADQEILRISESDGADLIVMGSHGRGTLDRLVFGSTVQRVVRSAPCPLIVVPAGHAWPATGLVARELASSKTPEPRNDNSLLPLSSGW